MGLGQKGNGLMGNEQMGNRGTFVHSSDMIFTLYNRLYNPL